MTIQTGPREEEDKGLRFLAVMVVGIAATLMILAVVVATSGHFFPADHGFM